MWDAASGRETRVAAGPLGLAYGWSHDASQILVSGPDDGRLYAVERATGRSRLVAEGAQRAMWVPAGIVYRSNREFIVSDPMTIRPVRTFDYRDPSITNAALAWDGRSVMALGRDGRIILRDVATGAAREWQDSGVVSLDGHFMAPHGSGVAYTALRKDVRGDATTLMFWGGSGEPRELLRAHAPDALKLAGWTGDGLTLLVARWRLESDSFGRRVRNETLWRVPVTGGIPVSTGLTLEGMRDISIHPDGRQIAFNAGWKRAEQWVMENLLMPNP